jgi:4-hydroxybenzoate polyprenyltransferase
MKQLRRRLRFWTHLSVASGVMCALLGGTLLAAFTPWWTALIALGVAAAISYIPQLKRSGWDSNPRDRSPGPPP